MHSHKLALPQKLWFWLFVLVSFPTLLCNPVQSKHALTSQRHGLLRIPRNAEGIERRPAPRSRRPHTAMEAHDEVLERHTLRKRMFEDPAPGRRPIRRPNLSFSRWFQHSAGSSGSAPHPGMELIRQESLALRPESSSAGHASQHQHHADHEAHHAHADHRLSRIHEASSHTSMQSAHHLSRHSSRAGAAPEPAQRAPRRRRQKETKIATKLRDDTYLKELMAEEEHHRAELQEASTALESERRSGAVSEEAQKRFRQEKLMHDLVHHRLTEYGMWRRAYLKPLAFFEAIRMLVADR